MSLSGLVAGSVYELTVTNDKGLGKAQVAHHRERSQSAAG